MVFRSVLHISCADQITVIQTQENTQLTYKIDVVSRITENFSQFRQAEQKVAQIILDDLLFAANASITELADKANVSKATITRLAKALGCRNVRDLKIQIAQTASVGERFIHEINVEPSGISGVYEAIHTALQHNSNLISQSILDRCVALLSEAKQVLIFGVGGFSSLMAEESQHRLFRLGVPANAYSDPMLMRMTAAASVGTNDAVICFSLSGYSPDVHEAAEIARQYGATIIVISPDKTPLSKIADLHLPIKIQESDYIFKPSASRFVMLAAIDVLMTELAVKNKRKSRDKLRRIKQTLDQHRQGTDRLPIGD